MHKSDVLKYFGGKQVEVCNFLGCSKSYVSEWQEVIPKPMAMELHIKTNGEERNGVVLAYDPALYGQKRDHAA